MLRRLRFLALTSLLTFGCAYALASWDWCGRWEVVAPVLASQGRATGALSVGAARVALVVPSGAIRAGYSPPRPRAEPGEPLHARALVLRVGDEALALASVDALFLAPRIVERVRAAGGSLGLSSVHLFATHTHSGFGGFDDRLVSKLAATGPFERAAEDELVRAMVEAITAAERAMVPAVLEVSRSRGDIGIGIRSEGEGPDDRLHLLQFVTETARHSLVLFAAHPTLHPREVGELDPDFPGRVSGLLEERGGVALFLQTAVGNTLVTLNEGTPRERMETFATSMVRVATEPTPERHDTVSLAHARVGLTLPRPEADRLVPALTRAAGDNFLCFSAPRSVEVSALEIGPLSLLVVPAEVTEAAGRALEEATGADRLLSLGDGYLGYVETADRVRRGTGEARRQYFPAELIEVLARGGKVAIESLEIVERGSAVAP